MLIVEAGGRDWHPYIHVPIGMGKLHQRRMIDWGFVTENSPGQPIRFAKSAPSNEGDVQSVGTN